MICILWVIIKTKWGNPCKAFSMVHSKCQAHSLVMFFNRIHRDLLTICYNIDPLPPEILGKPLVLINLASPGCRAHTDHKSYRTERKITAKCPESIGKFLVVRWEFYLNTNRFYWFWSNSINSINRPWYKFKNDPKHEYNEKEIFPWK